MAGVSVKSRFDRLVPHHSVGGLVQSIAWPKCRMEKSQVRDDHNMTGERQPLLSLIDVKKSYRGRQALQGVSLELFSGELLGFFGPNGAGKTTMIRCVGGLLRPDSGQIVLHPRNQVPSRLGLVPQSLAIYPDLTVEQNLWVFGKLEGVPKRELAERISDVLNWAALTERRRSLTKTLSGGMQRRLNIACSVLHQPNVLLLDEPTVGVDPQSRERIYDMIRDLADRGSAVLLTTHQLDEVETRCDRVVIMDHGLIVASGALSELIGQSIGKPHRVTLQFDRSYPDEVAAFEFDETRTIATCAFESLRELPRILAVLNNLDIEPTHINVQGVGLQDVFLEMTGRTLRE